jgi:hypothetical protein
LALLVGLLGSCKTKTKTPKTDCGKLYAKIKKCRKTIKKSYSKTEIARWTKPNFVSACKRWFKLDGPLAAISNEGLVKCLEKSSCKDYANCLAAVIERRKEAPKHLAKIVRSALSYREEQKEKQQREAEQRAVGFPESAPLTPPQPCCKQKNDKCRDSDWSHPTWKALDFEINEPHRFQYQLFSCGVGTKARLVARAISKPGCDGRYLVFERRYQAGKMNPEARKLKIYRAEKLPQDTCPRRAARGEPERDPEAEAKRKAMERGLENLGHD